ncbi:MAG: phytanoyl-CoA dioxygenase family protein [Gemmatimonadota bacterium]|nr:phytanoyl-CoA dioxygenase family protein [Gemmatimonadota bacterium]
MSGKTLIQYVEQFYRDGMVTVEGVFSADEAAALRDLLDRTIEEAREDLNWRNHPPEQQLSSAEGKVSVLWEVYERCAEARRFTLHPDIVRFAETTLGGPVARTNVGTMFDKVAGAGNSIGWHQDDFFQLVPPDGMTVDPDDYWIQLGKYHVQSNQIEPWTDDYYKQILTVRINIDPQREENGCLRVLPGSHKQTPFHRQDPDALAAYIADYEKDQVLGVAEEGSVTFYSQNLLHASQPNQNLPDGLKRRRVITHRIRLESMRIPGWEWPSDWHGVNERLAPAEGFTNHHFA